MNRFKHAKWWRSYLDKLKQGFWKFTGLNFKWKNERSIALCQSRSKYARKEQWRRGKQSEENRGQQLQSSFALLEHFPKSIFYMLYTIWKLRKSRIQRFKPCMIWSWNEEDMAFGRQLHHAKWPISQGEFHIAKISQGDFLHGAKFCHFAPWRNTLRKFRKVDLGTLRNSFESPVLRRCWCYSTAGSPRYFAWFLAL